MATTNSSETSSFLSTTIASFFPKKSWNPLSLQDLRKHIQKEIASNNLQQNLKFPQIHCSPEALVINGGGWWLLAGKLRLIWNRDEGTSDCDYGGVGVIFAITISPTSFSKSANR
ncbi:hypothetical protein L1887_26021 [Cichorium endivia]|nr:hypothetical protein L1887_26021 [Cichorium endivia]